MSGCATIVCFSSYWPTYSTAGQVVRFITGGLIGIVAPMAYVKWATHDRLYSRLTGIGSLAGMAAISIAPALFYLIGGAVQ